MKFSVRLFLLILLLSGCSSNGNSDKVISDTMPPAKSISRLWLGKWERRIWQNNATIEITNIKRDSIEFLLSASNGGHTGEIEGMAIIKEDLATYLFSDESDTCRIEFKLIGDSLISVEQKSGICFAGAAVTYSGEYKNSKNVPTEEKAVNLFDLGIFKTAKEDSLFKSLVGVSYPLFVNSTQLTSEDDDLDSLRTKVLSSGVRGLYTFMENIVMKDSLGNIWAAVIDDNKVYYFTNREEYKKRVPKTIDNWRQNFEHYELLYK